MIHLLVIQEDGSTNMELFCNPATQDIRWYGKGWIAFSVRDLNWYDNYSYGNYQARDRLSEYEP